MNLFGEYYRAFSNEQCNEIIKASEHLASNVFLLLGRTPESERKALLDKARNLTDRLMDTAGGESPMVAALALLVAIRTLEQLIQQQAEQRANR